VVEGAVRGDVIVLDATVDAAEDVTGPSDSDVIDLTDDYSATHVAFDELVEPDEDVRTF
jgi:hypothetical protein